MKNLFFVIAILFSLNSFSQTVQTVTPGDGDQISAIGLMQVTATLDETAYAVVFSLNPVGKTKVLKGKNKNFGSGIGWPSSNGDFKFYEWTAENIVPGEYTLRVDVYGTSFRDLTDSREVTFYVN